ncbi:cell division protein FtsQ/DivIB [Bosea sp. (in: a-proteobacteria)]|uniref:cell division protein FtsQ/DivIB n=1 Tax=Bosea sp. (in: a-proteobacteria) TaxID=1871050 RepID=UPI0026263F70|nr:cell division protein FtsQ/DivIB [Bosea sp. (in: a-proteobacteria)]MCO5091909.1 cell division protein FtsQ/DivIB [Bosea sp. (in: a-proteobacteria)]
MAAFAPARSQSRLPVPAAQPQLLVGERPGRWLRRSRRSAIALPLAQRLPQSLGTWLALGFLGVSLGSGLVLGGHWQTMQDNYGEPRHMLARALGFGIEHVTISGLSGLSEQEVLVAAGIDAKTSLVFFDADEARKQLEATPLIREAAVRKLYPGEVSIQLTEREPYALWQVKGDLFVIAADGTVIDKMDDGRFAYLPLVVGSDANNRAGEYLALRNEAGAFAKHIRAATLVSGRRWNLKLDNGMDVRLPESKPEAALKRLVSLENDYRILDKDLLAIDLRQPDRVVMRLSEEAAAARAEQLKSKSKKKGGEA